MASVERVEEILKETGVLLKGHFLLTSGRHSDKYMQCAQILQYPAYTAELLTDVAEDFRADEIDVVLAPAVGGILVAYELARQLNCRNLFAERENGVMTLRRGFALKEGARVLLAEDVITTGGTVFELIELVKAAGAIPVGVGLIVDRSNGAVDFGMKTRAAYTANVISYEADECPLCKSGMGAPVKPGSRNIK